MNKPRNPKLDAQDIETTTDWLVILSLYTPFVQNNPDLVETMGFESEEQFQSWRTQALESGEGYKEIARNFPSGQIDFGKFEGYAGYLNLLKEEEGIRNTVYLDSLGNPTVGVGHLVRPEDGLKVGDRISDAQVQAFLEKDARHAYDAAVDQAAQLGVEDPHFIAVLGSVNFQLGTGWTKKFPETWETMKQGDFTKAAEMLESSRWNQQTPDRVDVFQNALARIEQNNHMRMQFAENITDFEKTKPAFENTGPAFDLNKPIA